MAHSDRSNGKFKISLKLAWCLHKTVLTSIHFPFPLLAILDRKYSVQIVNMPNNKENLLLRSLLCVGMNTRLCLFVCLLPENYILDVYTLFYMHMNSNAKSWITFYNPNEQQYIAHSWVKHNRISQTFALRHTQTHTMQIQYTSVTRLGNVWINFWFCHSA